MRVVHVQLHAVEQVLHLVHLRAVALDQVLVAPTKNHLTRHRDPVVLLVPDRTRIRLLVVEHQSHCRLRYARLTLLVHQFLQILHAHLRSV